MLLVESKTPPPKAADKDPVESTTTGVPNDIDVPDTVPTTAVKYWLLPSSLYIITALLEFVSNVAKI